MQSSDARPSLKTRDPQIRAVVSTKGGVAAQVRTAMSPLQELVAPTARPHSLSPGGRQDVGR